MALSKILNYENPGNYEYDSDLIEITNSVARLKDLRPNGATLYATWDDMRHQGDSNEDVTWLGENATGSFDGELNGGASIDTSNNRLDLTGGTTSFLDFDASNGNADHAQIGTIRVGFTPNYSGTPSSNKFIFFQGSEGTGDNILQVRHNAAEGDLNLLVNNDNGDTEFFDNVIQNWSPTAGQTYIIEVDYDFNDGVTRLFVDGVQQGTTKSDVFVRDSNGLNILRFGASSSNSGTADHYIEFVDVYNTTQHTDDHAIDDEPSTTIYSTDEPTIYDNTTELDDLLSFEDNQQNQNANSDVGYILMENGVDKYFDGSSWINSDGSFNQSNTASEINNNAGSFTDSNTTMQVKAIFQTNGYSYTELDSVSFNYDFSITEPSDLSETIIYGWLEDLQGVRLNDSDRARLIVTNTHFKHGSRIIGASKTEVDFDSNGYVETTLVETESVDSSPYRFLLEYEDKSGAFHDLSFNNIQIPNEDTVRLTSILDI